MNSRLSGSPIVNSLIFAIFITIGGLNPTVVLAAPACQSMFSSARNGIPFNQDLLEVSGSFQFKNFNYDGKLADFARTSLYKKVLETASTATSRIHGRVKIDETLGGGYLRLTRLTLSRSNLAYNHLEVVALLKMNPDLAHRLGFFEVPGYDNLVWIPDIVQMNHRLSLIAQEQGIGEASWSYAAADGVLDFQPYIKMLSEGHFPFSNDSDMNLAIHDAMHAVAFAALNSTASSRKVMFAARTRSENVYALYLRLKNEFPEVVNSFEAHSGLLVSDGLEKTMLLTILITGNYNYFSVSNRVVEGRFQELQNKEITASRIARLLKLYANGNVNFKKFYSLLNKRALSSSRQKKLKLLFQEIIDRLEVTSESTLTKAANELLQKFFNSQMFSNSLDVKNSQSEAGTDIDTIYPERPLDMKVSDGEESMNL